MTEMKNLVPKEYYFTMLDFAVFIGMLTASSGIGIYFAVKNRKNHSNKDFLTSNKSLSLFPVAMSLLASFQSSVTILGYPAEMFYRASIIAAELFLPVFYRLNFTSVNQYLEQRFNSTNVRFAVSFSFLLCTVPYMGVVLYGPSLALETVTGLSVTSSILVIGCICTLYTSLGGIKAVVWTDVVQVFLMFSGLLVVMVRGFYLTGGISNAFKIASEHGRLQFFNYDIDLYSTTTFWNCVIGMGTMWSGNYATSQTEVQRYCNVTTQRKAKLSLYVNFLGVAFLISCACLCGIALFGVYHECDPLKSGLIAKTDQLMPYFVMDHLKHIPGMAGLFVSCVFSASLSTMSSGFNALATVTYDDFLSRTRVKNLPEIKIKRISKLIAFGYGTAAIAMAFVVSQINSILEAAISIAGALVGPMFGLFLCGILVPFANSFGVLCGLFSGEFFGIWLLIGSLIYPKPQQLLETSNVCPIDISNFTDATSSVTLLTTVAKNSTLYEREGLIKIYHISYLLVPVFGCIISMTVAIICSLLSGVYCLLTNRSWKPKTNTQRILPMG
ncbi:sodium-coupled monocarboxylate transporter 1-like protein 1 [Sarcoptes scabiei]|uniref:Sodium-coupled monocarboxylate transporter 1-like protein 1 n=1 Tax=Sarcoptes scabiei TaxID=52283 RepID=A0A132A350_SARSC|nr:sodium-coupled monocarboxylate transporter 1-like protein 1 [Sarcoptes scabiei]